jgi:DNA-binding protein H-NS
MSNSTTLGFICSPHATRKTQSPRICTDKCHHFNTFAQVNVWLANQLLSRSPSAQFYPEPFAHDVGVWNQIIFGGDHEAQRPCEILPSDELWVLHQKITATLKAKISAEKKVLEDRLSQLNGRFRAKQTSETPERRSYPTVFPKFRNPEQPSETWAGRGKKPRWLTAQLKSGKQIDDFRIDLAAA